MSFSMAQMVLILSEALAEGDYLSRGYDLTYRAVKDAEQAAKDFPLNWVKRNPQIKMRSKRSPMQLIELRIVIRQKPSSA